MGEGCNSNEEITLLSPNVLTLAPFLSHRLGKLLCSLLDQLPGPGTTLRSHDARVVARAAHAAPHVSPWLLLLLLWWSAPPSAVVGIVAWRVLLLRLHLAGRISRRQSPPGRRRSARGSLLHLHLHLREGHAEGRPRGRLRVRGRLPLPLPPLEEMRRLAPSRGLGLRWWRPLLMLEEKLRLRGRASSPLRRRLPLVPRGTRRLLLLLPPRRGDPSSSSPPLSFGRGGSRPPLRRLLLLLLLLLQLRALLLLSRRLLLLRDSLLLLGRLVPLG